MVNRDRVVDVLIVGGSVMGCAIAYYLLKKNSALKLLIIEKDSSYDKSSTVLSDGNIRVQFNLKENIEMSLYGLEVLSRFKEEMATNDHVPAINFHQQGNLFVVDDEVKKEVALNGLAQQVALGASCRWIDPPEVEALFPVFDGASCLGATYGPLDGTMSPLDVLLAYRRKAVALGAEVLEAEVAALGGNGRKITHIQLTTGETIQAPVVVNAAGPWARKLTDTVGINLPVKSIKRQVYSVEVEEKFEHILPMMILPNGMYLHHEGAGHFIVGGSLPSDPETYDDFSWSLPRFEAHLWEQLLPFFPSFDRLKVVNGWAGFYAVNTLDGNAILGEWPEMQGLYLANGFSGHGFQQCHAVGRYLAELILQEPHELDLSRFSPRRILENTAVYENPLRII